MRKIKSILKNVSEADKKIFKNSLCLLTISVGQQTHEDLRFAATIELINTTFHSYVITLHDSLQRYTIALSQNDDADFFHQHCIAEGDSWLARNEKFYKNFNKASNIIRWDTWLADPDFPNYKNKIISTINSDPAYRSIFDETINEYLIRYSKRLENIQHFNRKRAEKLCFDYLVEECAVLCLWPKSQCQFELYAGNHNAAMKETWKRFIAPVYSNPIRSITIGFNYRPDLQPQSFIHQNTQTITDLRE